jgi:hypothetical protein
MNQIFDSNLGKNSRKIARPNYPARGPDNPPPSKISQTLAVRQKFDRSGGMYIQQDS